MAKALCDKLDCRDIQMMENSFLTSSYILKREYLNFLTEYNVNALPKYLKDKIVSESSSFFEITQLVYNKDENLLDKLTTVSNAVYICGGTLVTILFSDGENTHFHIGIVNKKRDIGLTASLKEALQGSIKGNFNGSQLTPVSDSDILNPIDLFSKNDRTPVISAISNIPSERDNSEKADLLHYVQGIEKLVDSLDGRKYCILTIADAVEGDQCSTVKNSLEQLYSQLSGFETTEMSMNENSSVSNSKSYTDSFTETIGTNTSISHSHTDTTGWSTSSSDSKGSSKNYGAVAVAAAGLAAVGLTVATGGLAAVAAGGLAAIGSSTALGAAGITAAGGAIGGLIGSKSKTHTESKTNNGSKSDTETTTESEHKDNSKTKSVANTMQEACGTGKTLSFSVHNRTVKTVLDTIDEQIKRLNECGNSGAFSSCTYVITDDTETNLQVSSIFNALISGKDSYLQLNKVNSWGMNTLGDESEEEKKETLVEIEKIKTIIEYLRSFTHPLFIADDKNQFTAATLVSGKELALQLCFPKKSISGLTVFECAEFGRNIIRIGEKDSSDNQKISIGNIYHMHNREKRSVELSINDLSSHVFVTGSTGTGKSNVIYQLVDKLIKNGTGVLIIEPAKGEYKEVFGGRCQVYGTNPSVTRLLKINPFSFPAEVHVLEHIDRLIEILNACWPMYAAMPAVLKDAVEKAYQKRGWDLFTSTCSTSRTFPTFFDLLETLPMVLESSLYSNDTKGDYSGALITRIRSLTNGINGLVFCAEDEIADDLLFDRNVIVDISRVGATETKSLLMGIFVMKLQEYRMSRGGINSPLKHITILEEAHNLLKRTSSEQSQESANLQGKSVEMITNSIAEMRTYGEGFIIVDQAPALLDEAVIRNTNTKIVLRLPDENDRKPIGKALALKDNQIDDLARLPRGVAAVYQNDWLEAVLCAFDKFENVSPYNNRITLQQLLPLRNRLYCKAFSPTVVNDLKQEDIELLSAWIDSLKYKALTKSLLRKVLRNVALTDAEQQVLAYNLFDGSNIYKVIQDTDTTETGHSEMRNLLRQKLMSGDNISCESEDVQTTLSDDNTQLLDVIEQELLKALLKNTVSHETALRYLH